MELGGGKVLAGLVNSARFVLFDKMRYSYP